MWPNVVSVLCLVPVLSLVPILCLCLVASGLLLAPRGSRMGFWRVLGVWVVCGCLRGVKVREGRVCAP